MADFDHNFTTFPDHPFTESNEDSNFVSSIFNKVKSITSAASNAVHNALPLPNHDPLITPENAHTVIASAQLSRPGRLLSNHAPVRLPARSHPQALKELKYKSTGHSRNSSGGSFKTKNGTSTSDSSNNVTSHSRKVSLGRNTVNTSLSNSMHSISSIDTPPLIKVKNFNDDNSYFPSSVVSSDDQLQALINGNSINDGTEELGSSLVLPGTLSGNEEGINSNSRSSSVISPPGINSGVIQPVPASSAPSTTTAASAAAFFTPSASSLSLQNNKLTSDATVDRRNVTATGTFTTSQPTEIFNLRAQNSKLGSSQPGAQSVNPIVSSQSNNSLSSYHHTPHHNHINGSHHHSHHHHHHRTHKNHYRPHLMTPIPSASVVVTQNNQQSAPSRTSPGQGLIGSTLGTISQGMESLQSKLSLSSATDTNASTSNDANLDSSYASSFRENGSVLEKDYNSDAESIYSTAKRYFNSRVDRRPTPLKNGGLGKEFWMKDEHVTECFGCTAKFTTFRRKHHCRICGQIFCSKCTSLIDCEYPSKDGVLIKSKLRVCNKCYADMEKFESSDEDDESHEYHDHIDDAMSEFGETILADSNTSSKYTGSTSDLHTESPRAQIRKISRDERTGLENILFYSDDDSSTDEGDSDSVIHYSVDNSNCNAVNKWGDDHSRSPSRSRASFRRHRSGTSLSFDQPRFSRKGSRKKSFTAKTNPLFFSKPTSQGAGSSKLSAPLLNLNRASIAHSKAFLRQILEQKGITGNLGKWIDALMLPLLDCTSHIDLDNKIFEGSDFRSYVKLKRIPGGLPSHSQYIDGIVFSQTLTLKSMPQLILNPRILLAHNLFEHPRLHVSKILEISRQELSRFDTLVQRVTQLKPNIIMTTGGAGRFILKKLDQIGIAVMTNVKESVISRTSRYTQASIATYESLSVNTTLGHCDRFEVKTYRYQNEVRKYIFLSGIPKELGCTVVLRGADLISLGIIKRIVQFMVYMMFNLKLETSLLREEFALVPESPKLLKEIAKYRADAEHKKASNGETSGINEAYGMTILSTSPFVDYGLPYLLEVARKSEDQLVSMDEDKDSIITRERLVQMLQSDHFTVENVPGGEETIKKMSEFLYKELYQRLYNTWFKQNRQWELAHLRDEDMFTAEFHLRIVLLFSSVCTETLTPCFGPDIITFRFYSDKQDMPLGHFIERLCLDANIPCSEGCGRTLKQHTRIYAHGKGRITIKINDHACNLPGMSESILMWSTCKICHASTPILPMSDDTWKYSLGKYFELSFWSSELSFRENICPHNLYRDHVRFFGFKNIAVSIEYTQITLYEIVVPSARLTWQPERGIKLKVSCYNDIKDSVNKFYDSVDDRLNSIKVDELAPEKIDECRQKVEELLLRTKQEKQDVINELDQIFVSTEPTAYLPLNAVFRAMQDFAINWDYEFTEFEDNFFLSENDITRITAAHLKRIFLPNDIYEKPNSQIRGDTDESSVVTSEKSRKGSNESIYEKPVEAAAPENKNDEIEMAEICPSSELIKDAHDQSSTSTNPSGENLPLVTVTSEKPNEQSFSPNESDQKKDDQTQSNELIKEADKIAATSPKENETDTLIKDRRGSRCKSLEELTSIMNETAANTPSNIPRAVPISENRAGKEAPIKRFYSESVPDLTIRASHKPSTRSPSPSYRGSDNSNRVQDVVSLMESRNFKGDKSGLGSGDSDFFLHKSSSQLSFKPKISAIPLLKHPYQPPTESTSLNSDRMTEYAKLRLRSNSKSQEDSTSTSLSSNLNFRNKFDNIGYPAPSIRSRFGAQRDLNSQWLTGTQPYKISVSSLAEHYERLSMEFENQRARERRHLAQTQYRTAPIAASKPIVEVYKNVEDAVEERSPSEDEEEESDDDLESNFDKPSSPNDTPKQETPSEQSPKLPPFEDNDGATGNNSDTTANPSGEEPVSDESTNPALSDDINNLPGDQTAGMIPEQPQEQQPSSDIPPPVEGPNIPQTGLLKYLANFWADRSATGWRPLEYPLTHSDHLFPESNVIIREDEPNSLIAFCLSYPDYKEKLRKMRQEETASQEPEGLREPNTEMERHMLKNTGTHLKYQFQEGSAKLSCKIFYAEQFDAIRRQCDCEDSFIQSLSRCVNWESSGGKSGSAFLKTLDDRLVVKQLSQSELDAFIKFAPNYFEFMAQAFFHELPTALAKIFGFYQIQIRNPMTHKSIKMDVLVMENLFYNRKSSRIFDLKGSMRNRHVQQTGRENEVLLDENMVEFIYESPLFVRNHSKTSLRLSLFNDTLFLAKMNVMDYSLVVAIDDERQELIVGIIDFIRTFTWDKKLESWVKERGLVGGGVKEPTVVSPKQYKFRFREAMERYIMMVPDCWYPVNREEEEEKVPT